MVITEELLGGSTLDNLNNSGAKLLNGGNMASKDTHVTGDGSNVDLGNGNILVDGL